MVCFGAAFGTILLLHFFYLIVESLSLVASDILQQILACDRNIMNICKLLLKCWEY